MTTYTLGDFEFSGEMLPSGVSFSTSQSIVEIAVMQGAPRLQNTGRLLTTVSMSVMLHKAYCIPEDVLATLDAKMRLGSIMEFGTGAGDVYGDFIIDTISHELVAAAGDGSIIESTISLTLKESYSADSAAKRKNAARVNAFALSENEPIPTSGAVPSTSQVEYDASVSVNQSIVSANSIDSSAVSAAGIPSQEEFHIETIRRKTIDTRSKMSLAKSKIDSLSGDTYTNTRVLSSGLAAAIVLAGLIIDAITAGEPSPGIIDNARLLASYGSTLKSASSYLDTITATRR